MSPPASEGPVQVDVDVAFVEGLRLLAPCKVHEHRLAEMLQDFGPATASFFRECSFQTMGHTSGWTGAKPTWFR